MSILLLQNQNKSQWHLDHLRYSAEGFLNDETRKEYPIGRKTWLLDDRLCDISDDKTVLTLTACDENEFTCTDGTCQPLINRLQGIFSLITCCHQSHQNHQNPTEYWVEIK